VTDTNAIKRDVHTWFSLSYSNYLVFPRTFMQSMPAEWQERMVDLLEEMADAFEHVPQAEGYRVEAATHIEVSELTDEQMVQLGITADWYGGATPPEGIAADDLNEWKAEHEQDGPTYYRDGQEVDADEVVMFPVADPVPHYNRGRTYIEPRPTAP
jgi:hypothetical protein